MKTGFYVFPPTPENIIKCAIHDKGYTYQAHEANPNSVNDEASAKTGVSVPRTVLTPGGEGGFIPLEMLKRLRQHLCEVYPELGKRDFIATRLCWYLDTPDGDWLIDWHPKKENLLFATAGCGHAFKVGSLEVFGLDRVLTLLKVPAKHWSRDCQQDRRHLGTRAREQVAVRRPKQRARCGK